MGIVKILHISCAVLSILGFVVRGLWMIIESPWLNKKAVKILPHIIDTLLLITAVVLAWNVAQYPFFNGWLTAKVLGLVVYIGLGIVALHRGQTKSIRSVAFVLAVMTYAYIVAVAISRSPLLFV